MRSIRLFAGLTFKETVRSRTYGVILLFSIISTASVHLFVNFTSQEQDKFFKDVGFASMIFFSLILGVILGASQIHDDLETRNIYTALTNPVSCLGYLLGRFLGVILLVALALALMGSVFYFNLVIQKLRFLIQGENEFTLVRALGHALRLGIAGNLDLMKVFAAIGLESLLVVAVTMLFSVFLSVPMAVAGSCFLFLLGHLASFLTQMSFQFHRFLGHALELLLSWVPNFENFNIADAVVLGQKISWGYVGGLGLYSLVSVALLMGLAYRGVLKRMTDL